MRHAGEGRGTGACIGDGNVGWSRRNGLWPGKLFVFREFQEGVVGGAADHLVEGAAGGDHGVDAVFFFYLEIY